ncbi:MAG TPA: GNAT family N-acetyltransferase [Terricaulis sp.]|nr:GNAT family N-acetyltransferase [Terricaulis sp.]HRP10320.1 GNAT family N-acetyltransferase [Terricaulis sp.]
MGGLRKAAKNVLAPAVRAVWPAVEAVAEISARAPRRGKTIQWKITWDDECDAALAALPEPDGVSRALYRKLVAWPQPVKRHALVRVNGAPTALISLRRRRVYWEPAPYQCLPNFIAPAIDDGALGRALNALSLEVRIASGLADAPHALKARRTHDYEVYQADLTGEYAAHWNKKHSYNVRRARERCAGLTHRANGAGDLRWILDLWRQNWERDAERETVSVDDRLRFWGALAAAPPAEDQWRAHTVALLDGDKRVAGAVLLSRGDMVSFQCAARDPAYEAMNVGTRVLDYAMEWAAQSGFRCFDLGSGDYKKRWAPVGATRHAAIFRPALTDLLYRVDPLG